ncbi:MAG: hypothetical protein Fur0037_16380 [Planctomycetota bacterium]
MRTIAIAAAVLVAGTALLAQQAGGETARAGGDRKDSGVAAPDEDSAVPSDFVRFVEQSEGGHLDTAITTYRNEDGVMVTLLGAVHIADPSHYAELQRRFQAFDALLYELVGPEDYRPRPGDARSSKGFVSIMQNLLKHGLELQFQLDAVDYAKENFVHADMTADAFQAEMAASGESLLGLM